MLIIEDGTGKPDAESYATAEDLAMYAAKRGVTVPDDDAAREVLLVKAMDKLGEYDARWLGCRASATQALAWPRKDVWLNDMRFSTSSIPRELQYAQLAFAIEAVKNDLQKTVTPQDTGPVIEKTVDGAVTVKYANPGKVLPVSAFAKPEALVNVLLKRGGLFAIRA
ncbi:hypothetical protein GCM10009552_15940 [Rothia nasimurium]|uniref:Putative DnaT-like domain-containing protein n=1 Tax=Luteibacter anthropi TaxID=564369 RepID=A0A7X5UB32_9GAMM|nr:DnaT-like ssDNA-binding protein [Luteibacter anthropi]NII07256.1 hypothetical protein [Luteibacter anthropi]